MKQRSLFSILCFVLISFGVASVPEQACSNDLDFRPNSTYDANRRLILSSLPFNVTAQEDRFFYNGSMGQEPNRVYATGMCIPGSTSDDCFDCIKTGSDGLLQSCPNQTDGYSWPGGPNLCYVRYSNTSFSGSADLGPDVLLANTRDINTNITEFKTRWEELMARMIAAASTAKSSPSFSNNYYKAEVVALTPINNIYALMQCTPDLSSYDCNNCLRKNAVDYQSCCGQRQGGTIVRPICFLRWELYTYSKAFVNITVDSPPPPPVTAPPPAAYQANKTNNDSKGISAGVVVAIAVSVFVTVLILLVLGFGIFRPRKSYQTTENESDITTLQSLQFDFKTIEAATEKFARSNKLGQGGFGEVFKGTLPNGIEVAVKRLSEKSAQGALEFKNEVVLVAKLQHRNLVRLLGFCLEGVEKILVYEFVHNKSLDYFLFDPTKQGQLDWTK